MLLHIGSTTDLPPMKILEEKRSEDTWENGWIALMRYSAGLTQKQPKGSGILKNAKNGAHRKAHRTGSALPVKCRSRQTLVQRTHTSYSREFRSKRESYSSVILFSPTGPNTISKSKGRLRKPVRGHPAFSVDKKVLINVPSMESSYFSKQKETPLPNSYADMQRPSTVQSQDVGIETLQEDAQKCEEPVVLFRPIEQRPQIPFHNLLHMLRLNQVITQYYPQNPKTPKSSYN